MPNYCYRHAAIEAQAIPPPPPLPPGAYTAATRAGKTHLVHRPLIGHKYLSVAINIDDCDQGRRWNVNWGSVYSYMPVA